MRKMRSTSTMNTKGMEMMRMTLPTFLSKSIPHKLTLRRPLNERASS